MHKAPCPVCGSDEYNYRYYIEKYWGVVEQYGYCDKCGYTVEPAYSEPMTGFTPDITRGYKDYHGEYHSKNVRRRARIRKKHNIKRHNVNWYWP